MRGCETKIWCLGPSLLSHKMEEWSHLQKRVTEAKFIERQTPCSKLQQEEGQKRVTGEYALPQVLKSHAP